VNAFEVMKTLGLTGGVRMNYIAEWLDSYRRFWELRMEKLEEYLRKLQDKEIPNGQAKDTRKVDDDDSKHDGKH
jgi:hypothetical protein